MSKTLYMPTIHVNLKKYRLEQGITQEDLAEKLKVTRQTINAIEAGKYQPTLYLAYQCAEFFNVSIKDIFTFND